MITLCVFFLYKQCTLFIYYSHIKSNTDLQISTIKDSKLSRRIGLHNSLRLNQAQVKLLVDLFVLSKHKITLVLTCIGWSREIPAADDQVITVTLTPCDPLEVQSLEQASSTEGQGN